MGKLRLKGEARAPVPGSQSLSDSHDCPRIRILELKGLRSLVQFTIAQMGKLSPEARPPDTTTPACGPDPQPSSCAGQTTTLNPSFRCPLFPDGSSWARHGLGKGEPLAAEKAACGIQALKLWGHMGLWPSCIHSVVWWEDWAALGGKGDIRHCLPPNLSQLLARLT